MIIALLFMLAAICVSVVFITASDDLSDMTLGFAGVLSMVLGALCYHEIFMYFSS